MNTYSGYEYLLIDIANQFGHDKWLFEDRIQWVNDHMDQLEAMAEEADAKTLPLYIKAVMALRKAQQGLPTGHLVGLDACCSGIQVMSALTGCIAGAESTGMVNPNERADAYTKTTDLMNLDLGGYMEVERADAKSALMTSFYGSKKTPKDIFGEDTEELAAFYKAAMTVAPGAWELLQVLLASWQPFAKKHAWQLPDGFEARVKVMQKISARIEVDELNHSTFTYEWHENLGTERGLANAANVVHSVDAYVLRSIHRRCNYDEAKVKEAYVALLVERSLRETGILGDCPAPVPGSKLAYYLNLFERTNMVDAVILPYIKDGKDTQYLPTAYLNRLIEMVEGMLAYAPFEVITIHDEFKAHPNHLNHLRQQYINIMAELAESTLLEDILSRIHGKPGTYQKLSTNLSSLIRGSNYALS